MTQCSKRYGVIIDNISWPDLDEWPSSNTPELTESPISSPTSSVRSLDENNSSAGTTTSTDHGFSSFYFSTDDENLDVSEFHRQAAIMLAGREGSRYPRWRLQRQDRCTRHAERKLAPVPASSSSSPHVDLGCDYYGRSSCSCNKSFSTPFRLNEHIKRYAAAYGTGTAMMNDPCIACGSSQQYRSAIARHRTAERKIDSEKCRCPGSSAKQHTSSSTDEYSSFVASRLRIVDSDAVPQPWWIHGDELIGSATVLVSRDSGIDVEESKKAIQSSATAVVNSEDDLRDELCSTSISRELSKERHGFENEDFAQHLSHCALDSSKKRFACRESEIQFATQSDYAHSVAQEGYCGFSFPHPDGRCTGHHVPPRVERNQSLVSQCLAERLRCLEVSTAPSQVITNDLKSVGSRFSYSTTSTRDSPDFEGMSSNRSTLNSCSKAIDGVPTSPKTAAIRNARDSLCVKSMKSLAKLYEYKTGGELGRASKRDSMDKMRSSPRPDTSARTNAMSSIAIARLPTVCGNSYEP